MSHLTVILVAVLYVVAVGFLALGGQKHRKQGDD